MKKIICSLLMFCMLLSACSTKEAPKKEAVDGRDRPSSCGQLQVVDGKLAGENGNPVMLRGVSNPGITISSMLIRQDTYDYLSKEIGINVMRLALYTYGVADLGYCTGSEGARKKSLESLDNGINYAKESDMYAIIDWHILDDGDPNRFIDMSKEFFEEVSEKYKDYNNIIYEICNEPNGSDVDWKTIKSYAEQIIPIIRNHDPDSLIIVGTPNWSRDVDEAAKDPLDFDNVMYTLHFYAASHKQELRDKFIEANSKGLPIFVTEYGITASNGGFPIDEEESKIWIDLLEENGISYVMWNFSKTGEACSMLKKTTMTYTDYTEDDFNKAGLWLIETIKNHK